MTLHQNKDFFQQGTFECVTHSLCAVGIFCSSLVQQGFKANSTTVYYCLTFLFNFCVISQTTMVMVLAHGSMKRLIEISLSCSYSPRPSFSFFFFFTTHLLCSFICAYIQSVHNEKMIMP